MSKIRLVLTKEAERNFLPSLSSDNYSSLIVSILVPLDLLYTYVFRYDRLLEHDLAPVDPETNQKPNTQGFLIDYTSNDHLTGGMITIALLSIAAISLYQKYSKQQKEREDALNERNSSLLVFRKMYQSPSTQESLEDFNERLQKVFRKNSELTARYESIKLSKLEDQRFAFELETRENQKAKAEKEKKNFLPKWAKNLTNKLINPLWELLGLASFAFWILWIGAGLMTGHLDDGIYGLSKVLVYGVPCTVGFLYPILKIRNWYKNKGKDLEKENQAATDVVELTNKVFFELRKKRLMDELKKYSRHINKLYSLTTVKASSIYSSPEEGEQILDLKKSKKTRLLITGVTSALGTYIAVQYASWIITDFLYAVSSVSNLASFGLVQLGAGIACLVLAGITGIYKACQAYKGIKTDEEKIQELEAKIILKAQNNVHDLTKRFNDLKTEINALRKEVGNYTDNRLPADFVKQSFFEEKPEEADNRWDKYKSIATKAFHFVNGACSGIFIARLFLVKGTAIFLPFAAAALSNPITIGILVGVGLIYGGIKLYQYYQNEKERKAKELLEKCAAKVARLQDSIELAEMLKETLSLEKERLMGVYARKAAFESVLQVSMPPPVLEKEIDNDNEETVLSKLRLMAC